MVLLPKKLRGPVGAFINLLAVCEVAGFRKENLVKITTMVTEPGREYVTAGRSLAANIALAKHNARIAAEIAVAFAESAS